MSQFVCGYWIEFRDGGDMEYTILRRGTKKACKRVLDLLPGVAYSAAGPVKKGGTFLILAAEWDALRGSVPAQTP